MSIIGTLLGGATVGGLGYAAPSYVQGGQMFMAGFTPLSGAVGETIYYDPPAAGKNMYRYEGFGQHFLKEEIRGNMNPMPDSRAKTSFQPYKIVDGKRVNVNADDLLMKGKMGVAMSALGPAISGYYMYQGYQDNGLLGLADAYFLDLATSSAVQHEMFARKAPTSGIASGAIGTQRVLGFGGMALAGMGAYAGYGMGSAVAGAPGGFAGAFAGAKLGSLTAKYPGVMLPLAVGGYAVAQAGSMAISAVSHIVKEGYRRRKMRGRIDTAGDTAAFFNRNAITMRGRAFEAMRKSHLNARSALGMEANMTHMNRNYFGH